MDTNIEVKLNEGNDIISASQNIDDSQLHILKENIRSNLRKDYDKYSEKVTSIRVHDLKKYFDLCSAAALPEPSNTSIVLFFIGMGTIVCKIRNNNKPHVKCETKNITSTSDSETSEVEYIPDNCNIPEKGLFKRILGFIY